MLVKGLALKKCCAPENGWLLGLQSYVNGTEVFEN